MSGFEVVTLRNGQRALRERKSGEIMHPAVGPWTEAHRLYVEQGRLAERLCSSESDPVRVYDVGLGGAANAAAALACAEGLGAARRRTLELVSFERDLEPLALALADPQSFPFLTRWEEAARTLISSGTWAADFATWRLLEGDALRTVEAAPEPADLVFFDPFSPKANPGFWTVETLAAFRRRAREAPPAELFTYSAATPTRVSLLLAGFYVGAGVSVAGKAETTAASTGLAGLRSPLGARWIQRWKRSSAFRPELDRELSAHPQFAQANTASNPSR